MRLGQYRTTETETWTDDPWCGVPADDRQVINLPEAGAAAGIHIDDETTGLLADWEWQRKAELTVEYAGETGVGVYREPPVLLEDGDRVTIGVEEIGELTNRCAFEST